MKQSHELHKRHLLDTLRAERGDEWMQQHAGLLDEQLEMLARDGVVLTDEEAQEAQAAGKALPAVHEVLA
jgi:hypothetical protein